MREVQSEREREVERATGREEKWRGRKRGREGERSRARGGGRKIERGREKGGEREREREEEGK